MLDVEFMQLSDPGRVRGHNEDYLGHAQAGDTGWLFALADGIEARYKKAKVHVDKLTQTILAKAFCGDFVLRGVTRSSCT